LFPAEVYGRFIRGYTHRQWGIAPDLLDRTLAERLRINEDHEDTLIPEMMHQGLPTLGYAGFVANLLAGIPYIGGIDYLKCRGEYHARKALIFTGPIDEYFGFDLGRLMYRAQKRRLEFFRAREWHQPCAQVNHPDAEEHQSIRTIEWKHLMPAPQRSQVSGSVITDEYPFTPENPNDYEYPVPVRSNRRLYARYHRRAMKVPRLIVCGRLGECRYLDMNHAIENATAIAHRLLRFPRQRCVARRPEFHYQR
jgi:UDP-galactopyranose mutase